MDGVPREQNQEADAITNGNTEWRSESNEIVVDLGKLPFIILPELLSEGSVFYAGLDQVNAAAADPPKFHKQTLRVRDPFG